MTPSRPYDPRTRIIVCAECEQPFEAPRMGRPPKRCSADACQRAAAARWQREYRRGLVRDREELHALRQALSDVAA